VDVALKKAGGVIIRTDVGDKNVIDEMLKGGFNLGGEQSGHIEGVGFDLYLRLVGEAVAVLKGEAEGVAPEPSEIKVEYKNTNAAHALRFRAGVELLDARTIVSRADTWWDAWKQFYF
jgi:hypothetical protein